MSDWFGCEHAEAWPLPAREASCTASRPSFPTSSRRNCAACTIPATTRSENSRVFPSAANCLSHPRADSAFAKGQVRPTYFGSWEYTVDRADGRSGGPDALARLKIHNVKAWKARCQIEKIFGTCKRGYGLHRMRWFALAKAGLQVRLTAIALQPGTQLALAGGGLGLTKSELCLKSSIGGQNRAK